MDGISCDRCEKALLVSESVRYEVRIRVQAAYDPMEITSEDLDRDFDAERKALLEQMQGLTEEEAMDQVFREMRFDLCPACQKQYLKSPLPK